MADLIDLVDKGDCAEGKAVETMETEEGGQRWQFRRLTKYR